MNFFEKGGEIVLERMSFFAKLCKVDVNPELGMWLLYGIIIILSALVYNLGFARKLSIIKNIVIYIVSDWMYGFNFLCSFFTCW